MSTTTTAAYTNDDDVTRAVAYLDAVKVASNKYAYREGNGHFAVTPGTLRVLGVYLRAYPSESEAFDKWCWDTAAEEIPE